MKRIEQSEGLRRTRKEVIEALLKLFEEEDEHDEWIRERLEDLLRRAKERRSEK